MNALAWSTLLTTRLTDKQLPALRPQSCSLPYITQCAVQLLHQTTCTCSEHQQNTPRRQSMPCGMPPGTTAQAAQSGLIWRFFSAYKWLSNVHNTRQSLACQAGGAHGQQGRSRGVHTAPRLQQCSVPQRHKGIRVEACLCRGLLQQLRGLVKSFCEGVFRQERGGSTGGVRGWNSAMLTCRTAGCKAV